MQVIFQIFAGTALGFPVMSDLIFQVHGGRSRDSNEDLPYVFQFYSRSNTIGFRGGKRGLSWCLVRQMKKTEIIIAT